MSYFSSFLPFLFFDKINWVFHVYFMLFFLCFGLFFWIRDRREKKALATKAATMGLAYFQHAPERLEPVFKRFDLLREGTISCASQVFEGTHEDKPFYLFNWYYKSDPGLKAIRGGFSCAILELPNPFPFMNVFPRHLSQFIKCAGMEQKHASEEAFSQAFAVACRVPQFAQAFLHNAMTAFFMERPNMILEIANNSLLIAIQGELTAATVEEDLTRLKELAKLLPHARKKEA